VKADFGRGLAAMSVALAVLCAKAALAAEAVPGELLVKHRAGAMARATQAIRKLGATTSAQPLAGGVLRVRLGPGADRDQALASLRADPGVEYAEPNYRLYKLQAPQRVVPNDPLLSEQYGLERIQAFEAWALGRNGVPVAVLDDGISPTHPDLAGRVAPGADFFCLVSADNPRPGLCDPTNPDHDPGPENDHGTAVAGVIGATPDNGIGIAGLLWTAPIIPLKVFGLDARREDVTDCATVSAAIDGAAGIPGAIARGARVINLSIASDEFCRTLADAIRRALDADVVVVAASGNTPGQTLFPADQPGVIAVGATNAADQWAGFSPLDGGVSLVAPGSLIRTTADPRNSGELYSLLSGTSFATPYVAGVAALVLARNPGLPAAGVKAILEFTADPPLPPRADRAFGAGRLNALRAVQSATADRPRLLRPPDGSAASRGSPGTLTFSWTGVPWATYYGFEYTGVGRTFANPNGIRADPVNGFRGAGGGFLLLGTTLPVRISPAAALGRYQWRAIAVTAMGEALGTFSDAFSLDLTP
jgi:subtilisin family serine protease